MCLKRKCLYQVVQCSSTIFKKVSMEEKYINISCYGYILYYYHLFRKTIQTPSKSLLGRFLFLGRLRCPGDYFLSSLLGFGLLNGVPGACRAAHEDSDGATPRAAMLHGGWAPTKMSGCVFGRNIRKMQLLFEKCPHSILLDIILILFLNYMRGLQSRFCLTRFPIGI